MQIKISEVLVMFPDVIVEQDGKKVLDVEALKAMLERLQSKGVTVSILPDGPPPTGK